MIRVVIADDERKVSLLIRNLVDWGSIGMEVAGIANNGPEALELVRSVNPDILITDIRMSGIDGLELIKCAKEHDPRIEVIIISGYGNFDYAQTALRFGVRDYILKPVNREQITGTLVALRDKYLSGTRRLSETERMSFKLKGAIERLRISLLDEIMESDGEALGVYTLADINGRYHYAMRPGYFRICALKIDGDYRSMPAESLAVLMDKCGAALKDELSPECYDMELKQDNGFVYVLLNYAAENSAAVNRNIRSARDKFRELAYMFKGAEFTISMGVCAPEPGMIGRSFRSARFGVMQRLFSGCGSVLENSSEPEAEPGPAPFDGSGIIAGALAALESSLDQADYDGVSRALADFAGKLLAHPGISGESLIATCQGLFDRFLSLKELNSNSNELNSNELSSNEFSRCLNMCSTAEKALDYVKQAVETLAAAALKRRSDGDTVPIRAAKRFIQENYMKQITLDEVSGIAGFNPSYFSHLFKKETGKNYLEYLSDLRVKKARDLLRETKCSVAEVCAAVGYSDIKHFTKIFKKIIGISPREFRKLYS